MASFRYQDSVPGNNNITGYFKIEKRREIAGLPEWHNCSLWNLWFLLKVFFKVIPDNIYNLFSTISWFERTKNSTDNTSTSIHQLRAVSAILIFFARDCLLGSIFFSERLRLMITSTLITSATTDCMDPVLRNFLLCLALLMSEKKWKSD